MALRLSEHLQQDRPRERFWTVGPGALTSQELLAILLGTGTRGHDALSVAGAILARADGSFRRLASRPWAELAQIPGVGRTKAARRAGGGARSESGGGTDQGRAAGRGAGAGPGGDGGARAADRAHSRAGRRATLLRRAESGRAHA